MKKTTTKSTQTKVVKSASTPARKVKPDIKKAVKTNAAVKTSAKVKPEKITKKVDHVAQHKASKKSDKKQVSETKEVQKPTSRKRNGDSSVTKTTKAAKKAPSLPHDETLIQVQDLPGEVTVTRVARIKAFQLFGSKWEEVGPGSIKVSINEELTKSSKKKAKKGKDAEKSCKGRLLFHDAENRNVRLNLPLGSSFSIAKVADPKVLIFTAICPEQNKKSVVQETYLMKEAAGNPLNMTIEKFKSELISWNTKLTE